MLSIFDGGQGGLRWPGSMTPVSLPSDSSAVIPPTPAPTPTLDAETPSPTPQTAVERALNARCLRQI